MGWNVSPMGDRGIARNHLVRNRCRRISRHVQSGNRYYIASRQWGLGITASSPMAGFGGSLTKRKPQAWVRRSGISVTSHGKSILFMTCRARKNGCRRISRRLFQPRPRARAEGGLARIDACLRKRSASRARGRRLDGCGFPRCFKKHTRKQ